MQFSRFQKENYEFESIFVRQSGYKCRSNIIPKYHAKVSKCVGVKFYWTRIDVLLDSCFYRIESNVFWSLGNKI